jgi:hypothetical protein
MENLMTRFDTAMVLKQVDEVIGLADTLDPTYSSDTNQYFTAALAVIDRVAGRDSVYWLQARHVVDTERILQYQALRSMRGVVSSLRADVERGYLVTLREVIHADLFADFLEMAEYLISEGYKDPAAVLAGSVLEEHLRKLCQKNNIPVEAQTSQGLKPKKADTLNGDLGNASVYSKLEQKSVTAWLDLRNKAAHGHYSEYTKEQVDFFLMALRDFITRNPA